MMGVGGSEYIGPENQFFSEHEQMTFTKAISVAESFGKKVSLLVVPAGDVFAALVQSANSLEVDSIVSGVSSKMSAEEQAFHLGQAWEALAEPNVNSTSTLSVKPAKLSTTASARTLLSSVQMTFNLSIVSGSISSATPAFRICTIATSSPTPSLV